MTIQARVRIVIDVMSSSGAPQGSLEGPDGVETPFDGWLQLLAALQKYIGEPADEEPADTSYAQNARGGSP